MAVGSYQGLGLFFPGRFALSQGGSFFPGSIRSFPGRSVLSRADSLIELDLPRSVHVSRLVRSLGRLTYLAMLALLVCSFPCKGTQRLSDCFDSNVAFDLIPLLRQ